MSKQLFTNNAISFLQTDLSETDLIIELTPGAGAAFPQPTNPGDYFLVTLESAAPPLTREIVKVVDRQGDLLILSNRGWENTTVREWQSGDTIVDHRVTAGTIEKFQTSTSNNTTSSLNIGPLESRLVNTLDLSQNKSCKWIVTVQTEDDRICVSEIMGLYRPAGSTYSQYAKIGDRIGFTISVLNGSSDMQLIITNTDSAVFSRIDITRIQHF